MESLSRHHHSRKLSGNAGSFSGKNAYAGMFSGSRRSGAATVDVQDYKEIFGSSKSVSSIPVLDVSSLEGAFDDLSAKLRGLKPDYDKIFGGFRDHEAVSSLDDVFASDKSTRATSSTTSSSQDSDNWSRQSSNDVKQFNMSYNKISPKSKDGIDVTKHVTQLCDTPGFTCFIDEPLPIPSPKMKPEKRTSSPKKRSSENVVRKQSKNQPVEPVSEYKYFKASDNDLKIHHARVSSPSASRDHLANHTTSESVPGGFSNTYFDEEADVNSAAYVSAAALRKAIEKAQETMRIAKESVGRKKKGLKSSSNKTSENSSAHEVKIDDILPNSLDGKNLFAAKNIIDEMNGKISESTKEHSKPKDDTTVSSSTRATEQTESRPLESVGIHENATLSSESIGTERSKTEPSDSLHDDETDDLFVNDYQDRIEVTKLTIGILEQQSDVKELEPANRVEDNMAIETKEIKDEVRLSNVQELSNEFDTLTVSQKVEDEYEVSQRLLENEKLEEVLEREHVESDKGIDEDSEWSESENEFKDDENVEIRKEVEMSENEFKDDDNIEIHKEVETSENEFKDDDNVEIHKEVETNEHEFKDDENVEIHKELETSENEFKDDDNVEIHKEVETNEDEFKDDEIVDIRKEVETSENEFKDDDNVEIHKEVETSENEFKDDDNVEIHKEVETNEHKFKDDENVEIHKEVEMNEHVFKDDDVEIHKEVETSENEFKDDDNVEIHKEVETSENEFKDDDNVEIHKEVETNEHKFKDDENVEIHKEVEMSENEFKDDDNVEIHKEVETSENEFKDDDNVEIHKEVEKNEHEFKDDENVEIHKEVETSEVSYNVCEVQTNRNEQTCNDITEESIESVEKFDNSSEEHDDREMEQEEKRTAEKTDGNLDNTSDQEFEDKSSCDDNAVEETDSIKGIHDSKVDMNDNDVEANQEVEDVAQSSIGIQVEDTDLSASDTDDDDLREVTSDDLADVGSDDTGFGQHETEESDVKSESSSGIMHGMKLEEEESNTQVPHNEIPDIESTKFKVSDEPINEDDKKDEIKGSEKDYSRRIEEMTAKRHRLAVERAVREARERALAESRERVERERAAKATEEVRQRMMADAFEKASKASAGTQSSSEQRSERLKLRAERAAVERATLEARERALEKAHSQKNAADKKISESALRAKEKLEMESRIKERADKNISESAKRAKSKFEKESRIKEKAANKLAEHKKREQLAQKEQAEKNRLAGFLDADIKRWSNGKEKDLRLLLSTLQDILGPDSGWQPISLTDLASSAAVKKAYLKSALRIHPDKLQQRGASIKQKYICEKVFDLIKAAWNRYRSEEK